VSRRLATVIKLPGKAKQKVPYEHCLSVYGARSRWMMFCDDDEFLFPCADTTLPVALAPYEKFAGLAVSWMLYGSSGHLTRPPGLVIANYPRRSVVPDHHVKCIVDPARMEGCELIAHHFKCTRGEAIVDEAGEPMGGPFRDRPSATVFRINHYLTQWNQIEDRTAERYIPRVNAHLASFYGGHSARNWGPGSNSALLI